MSYFLNNQQHFNEVVFESRNKEYGAYAICSQYGNTLLRSIFLVSLFSCTAMSIAWFVSRTEEVIRLVPEQLPDISTMVDLTPKTNVSTPKKNQPQKPGPRPAGAAAAVATTVIDSVAPKTESPKLNEFAATNNNPAENTATAPEEGSGTAVSGMAETSGTADHDPGKIEEDFGVDTPAEFEGGLKALYRFVGLNLRYPEVAADMSKEGVVYVKFVVDEKGRVGSLVLENKLGYGLDDEAKRVVALIPAFRTPAKVKGRAVKVYFRFPISFRLH